MAACTTSLLILQGLLSLGLFIVDYRAAHWQSSCAAAYASLEAVTERKLRSDVTERILHFDPVALDLLPLAAPRSLLAEFGVVGEASFEELVSLYSRNCLMRST